MIQTTKDADKAKTSQRQRVDDQNDRFVSRNRHHAPPTVALFWALLILFNGFARDRKRTSSVQCVIAIKKRERGIAQRLTVDCIPAPSVPTNQTSVKVRSANASRNRNDSTAETIFRSWDTGQKVLLPVLVPSVARGGGQQAIFSNCPASAEVFHAVIIKKLSERY